MWTTICHFCRCAVWIHKANMVQKFLTEDLKWSGLHWRVPSGDWQEQTQKLPGRRKESSIQDSRNITRYNKWEVHPDFRDMQMEVKSLRKSNSLCEIWVGQAQWFSYILGPVKTVQMSFDLLDLILGDFFVLNCLLILIILKLWSSKESLFVWIASYSLFFISDFVVLSWGSIFSLTNAFKNTY